MIAVASLTRVQVVVDYTLPTITPLQISRVEDLALTLISVFRPSRLEQAFCYIFLLTFI